MSVKGQAVEGDECYTVEVFKRKLVLGGKKKEQKSGSLERGNKRDKLLNYTDYKYPGHSRLHHITRPHLHYVKEKTLNGI